MEVLLYIANLIVYGLLVSLSGLIIGDSLIRDVVSEARTDWQKRLMRMLSRSLVLAILLTMFIQLITWAQSYGGGKQLVTLLLEGSTGRTLLLLLVLSMLYLVVEKVKSTRLLFVLLLLLAESMNGHASDSVMIILFDFVHLVSISIWIGGVIYFLVNWKDGAEHVVAFIKKYTKLVWLSIAAASVSGAALTAAIVPSISYLLYTSWGQVLLIKIVVVIVALWLGYKARTTVLNNYTGDKSRILKIEFTTLMIIVALAALISTLSPTPSANQALNYHQMGDELHYTVKLSPNAPGPNNLSLSLWTLQEEGEVAEVQLTMHASDKPRTSARAFTLQPVTLEDNIEFPGFNERRYVLDELKLPYPSSWEATIDILFSSGQQRQFSFTFEN